MCREFFRARCVPQGLRLCTDRMSVTSGMLVAGDTFALPVQCLQAGCALTEKHELSAGCMRIVVMGWLRVLRRRRDCQHDYRVRPVQRDQGFSFSLGSVFGCPRCGLWCAFWSVPFPPCRKPCIFWAHEDSWMLLVTFDKVAGAASHIGGRLANSTPHVAVVFVRS